MTLIRGMAEEEDWVGIISVEVTGRVERLIDKSSSIGKEAVFCKRVG